MKTKLGLHDYIEIKPIKSGNVAYENSRGKYFIRIRRGSCKCEQTFFSMFPKSFIPKILFILKISIIFNYPNLSGNMNSFPIEVFKSSAENSCIFSCGSI